MEVATFGDGKVIGRHDEHHGGIVEIVLITSSFYRNCTRTDESRIDFKSSNPKIKKASQERQQPHITR